MSDEMDDLLIDHVAEQDGSFGGDGFLKSDDELRILFHRRFENLDDAIARIVRDTHAKDHRSKS